MPTRDPKDPKVIFGKNLRALRTKRGLSQERLAESADLHRNMVNFLENGRRNPSLATIVKLARALKIPTAKFFKNV